MNFRREDELLCLMIPLTEEQLFEVLYFIKLRYSVSFEEVFFNCENKIKLILVMYYEEDLDFREFDLQIKYCQSQVKCYAQYEDNHFLYYSPDFDNFLGKYFDLRLASNLSAFEMAELGFELGKSPFWFSHTSENRFISVEQQELSLAERDFKIKRRYTSFCTCTSIDGGLATIMNLANQLMDKLCDQYLYYCKILFLTRRFAIFEFEVGQFNCFMLNVSEVVDFDVVEEIISGKIVSLRLKYENLNYNIAKKRISDYEACEQLFDELPSLKTKILYEELNMEEKECIVNLREGINKISVKLSVVELNELIQVIRHEFFELYILELTYYPEIEVLAASVRANSIDALFLEQEIDYFRRCEPFEQLLSGVTYEDQKIETIYRIYRSLIEEYDGQLTRRQHFEINEFSGKTSYFTHFAFSFVCEQHGIPSYIATNATGATVVVVSVDYDGEKLSTCIDFENRLFLVDESVLLQRFQFHEPIYGNELNNVVRKFFFRAKNAVMLEKFVKQLIESADATESRTNAFSSMNASGEQVSTHRSVYSSGRIELFEKEGRWEVRLGVLDENSYEQFIDNFEFCLTEPNGEMALDLEQIAYGQIIDLEMCFSDPFNIYCHGFRGKRGTYLIDPSEALEAVSENSDMICGVASLGQVWIIVLWKMK